ncbi:hypothetical protein GRF29_44g594772 [Pseudopithomyces chartarum]|uniref:Uncharacterized protein n=1 Tax=Pseudopithomyces chartarum TaxID=1892770 RepID=A0AAN6LXU9_9PLEO|nr:hypothetical protein GRF29_44g594772 [Pseudopithomyces chartarum]
MPFTASDIIKIIFAIFLPPLGVFLERGCNADFFINILLTILGYIPGQRAMNAALIPAEIQALNQPDRSCEDANRQLGHAGAHRDAADSTTFEESMRLKNTLDAYEAQAKSKPSWEALSVLVNCEYRLYVLNQSTPLRTNPFLSHWVEAIQRLGTPTTQSREKASDSVASHEINLIRTELIKALLQSRNPSQFARTTPRQLHNNYVEMRQTSPFNIRTYIRMLEEEGIYERSPSSDSDSPASTASSPSKPTPSKLTDFQRWKLGILSRAFFPRLPNHIAARASPAPSEDRPRARDRGLHTARVEADGGNGRPLAAVWRGSRGEREGGADKGREVVVAFHAKSYSQGFVATRIDVLRDSGDLR